jgi:hypothetical protein
MQLEPHPSQSLSVLETDSGVNPGAVSGVGTSLYGYRERHRVREIFMPH